MARLRSDKQEQFVQEYLIDLNATQAAIRAGYSVRSAQQLGSDLLSNHVVRARVDELLAERSRRTGVTQDRVIRELARLAFVNAPDVINLDEATVRDDASQDDTAAIASVKVKRGYSETGSTTEREVRLHDKIKALELLGKHLGMYTDKLDLNIPVTIVIEDDYGDDEN